jgi:hypothetical protein
MHRYFNILFKVPGQPPPITQINVSQEQAHRNANISRFVSACSKSGIPAERIPLSSDLTTGGTRGLSRTISAINGLTRLPRPVEALGRVKSTADVVGQRARSPTEGLGQRAKSPTEGLGQRAMSPNPTVRFAGSRPPSRAAVISPPGSPPQRTRPLASLTPSSSPPSRTRTLTAKSPSVSPTRIVASPPRIMASPTRIVSNPQASRPTSQPTSRGMEKSRSADSTNDLQLKLLPSAEAQVEDPEKTPTTTPNTSAILQTPSTPSGGNGRGLLPRQGLSRTPTQANGSPALRPKSPSTSTSGSITPTHRRPSLRPRNTTASVITSTRVSFAEESSSGPIENTARPAPSGLHMKERTPSLISASTRPSTGYTRSSAAYSTLTVMDNDTDDAVFVEDGSFGRSGIHARSRRNSEKTLQDARQRIMGSILVADGMTLRETEETEDADERAAAIQSSLAALEGGSRTGARTSPPRPLGPRRGQSLGITGLDMPNSLGEDGLRGAITPDARRAYANGRYSAVISPRILPPGASPERSPMKDTFDMGASPPMSRVNSRVSGEYRPILRPRQTTGNGIYGYQHANSGSAISIIEPYGRNDNRTRLSSIIGNSQSSGRSVELPIRSRPVSVITLDIPAKDDVVRYVSSSSLCMMLTPDAE